MHVDIHRGVKMIVLPKEKPVMKNLNMYYLDIGKLIEHFQGEIGSGGLFFKSANAEGVIFFDTDEILNGYFHVKDNEISGYQAIDRFLETDSEYNFNIDVYRIPQEEVYFWSSLPSADKIYRDLSTEFTDLEGLIKKMVSEKLTGFIDISISNGDEGGLIFMSNGEIIGGSFSWAKDEEIPIKRNLEILISKLEDSGGVFQVSRIPLKNEQVGEQKAENSTDPLAGTIKMLEELLGIFENLFASRKDKATDFNKALRQKFVEKAERYANDKTFQAMKLKDRIVYISTKEGSEMPKSEVEEIARLAKMKLLGQLR